jgi:hypothetical protein
MSSPARQMKRKQRFAEFHRWQREARLRGLNQNLARQLATAAFAQFMHDKFTPQMNARDVFDAGFRAGLLSVEYVVQGKEGEAQLVLAQAQQVRREQREGLESTLKAAKEKA